MAPWPLPPQASATPGAGAGPPPLPAPWDAPPAAGMVPGEPVPPKPRIWTVVLTTLLAPVAVVAMSAFGFVVLSAPRLVRGQAIDLEIGSTPWGMATLVLFSHGAMILLAGGAALISPRPWRERLGLVRPRLPWRMMVPCLVGTMATGTLGMLVLALFFHAPSPGLLEVLAVQSAFRGPSLLYGILTFGLFVGFAEELFFRGYLQTRLLRRWRPLPVFLVVNLLFGLAHIDPHHMVTTFILGLWLSVLCWRAHSVWPAVICHAGYNAFVVVTSSLADPPDLGFTYASLFADTGPVSLAWYLLALACLAGSALVLARTRIPDAPVVG